MQAHTAPLISVVVPAYNAAGVLPACLAALRSQDLPPAQYEILVVDDGSSDGTAASAAAGGASRVIRLPHGGAAAARNAGITAAAGEYILFTDADCEPIASWLREMTRPFADPEVAAVKGAYRTRQRAAVARLAQCEFEERYDRLERTRYIDFVDTHAAAYRAAVLRGAGGFDPGLVMNEDVDLAYRLAGQGRRMVFNRRAAVYHAHRATWRGYLRLKLRRGYWRMLVYRQYPGKALADTYTPHLLKVQVLLVYAAAGCLCLALGRPARAWAGAAALTSAAGLLASSLPFTRLVARIDPPLAPWAPVFVVARAAAFALGVAAGAAAALRRRPQPSRACLERPG